jgi:carbamate kinase
MLTNLTKTCEQIAQLLLQGHSLCLTHGNGPQVGQIYLRNQMCSKEIPPWSLNLCVAESEGLLGYMFQQTLTNALRRLGLTSHTVASLVTQIEVSATDPAFQKPNKPIGHFYNEKEAREKMLKEPGCVMKQDAGRGWRVVVPSPRPLRIIEAPCIRALTEQENVIVVASGGGGVPVLANEQQQLRGCDAVIDKDHAAVILARVARSNLLMLITDVDYCYEDYGKSSQNPIYRMNTVQAKEMIQKGHFHAGSMLPKVEACVDFVEMTGQSAVITSLDKVAECLTNNSKMGTWFGPA